MPPIHGGSDALSVTMTTALVTALETVFGVDAEPLLNLRDVSLTYTPGRYSTVRVVTPGYQRPACPLADQDPFTVLGSPADLAGWPNGRRPIDDVTDVAVRVVGGINYLTAGDNVNERSAPTRFLPFLSTPWDGLNRIHQNPPGTQTSTPTPIVTGTETVTGTPGTPTPPVTFTPTGTSRSPALPV